MSLLKTSLPSVIVGHAAIEAQSASHTCPPPPPPPPPAAPPPVTQGGWSDGPVTCVNYTYYWTGSPRQFALNIICSNGVVQLSGYFYVTDADWQYYEEHGYLPHNGGGYF